MLVAPAVVLVLKILIGLGWPSESVNFLVASHSFIQSFIPLKVQKSMQQNRAAQLKDELLRKQQQRELEVAQVSACDRRAVKIM